MRFITLLLIIIIAVVVIFFMGKSRLPDMLANNLSKKLQVAVSIDSMDLSFSKIDANQLEIGNPKGFSLPKAFSAKEIEVTAPITEYFRDSIVIEEIDVNEIYLGLEFNTPTSSDGNWTAIMDNFQKSAHLEEAGPSAKKVLIKKLVFNDIQTDLLFRQNGGKIKKLPQIKQIVLTNISSEGGFPTDQLMSSILGQMLKEVFIQNHLNNMIKGFVDSPGKAVDTLTKPFKEFFNSAPKKDTPQLS